MTEEQINASLASRELKLVGWRRYTHFFIVWLFLFIGVFSIFFYLKDLTRVRGAWFFLIFFTIIPFCLALFYYKRQRSKLSFKIVESNLTRKDLDKIVEKVAKELKWDITTSNEEIIEAKTSPGFLSGSWGELITILFENGAVLVNSICDPDKKSSVVSFGRNEINTDRLVEEIEIASR